ncbi:hypothetical protein BpHYR1_024359 [Brachionus plicatilis]|uniref:Uncharacterized protein n=1 Tax=Brachionus plicatilis TaxID=10195 RepID=A0A3M7PND7_BRAPC|nr:hypothetical protein BpHYR1_024359 [Brachionus plicatilis]
MKRSSRIKVLYKNAENMFKIDPKFSRRVFKKKANRIDITLHKYNINNDLKDNASDECDEFEFKIIFRATIKLDDLNSELNKNFKILFDKGYKIKKKIPKNNHSTPSLYFIFFKIWSKNNKNYSV